MLRRMNLYTIDLVMYTLCWLVWRITTSMGTDGKGPLDLGWPGTNMLIYKHLVLVMH